MKIRKRLEDMRRLHKRPANIVIGASAPYQINEVVINGLHRFRIIEAIGREEFMRQVADNFKRESAIGYEGTAVRSKVDLDAAQESTQPGPGIDYYYRAALISE